MMRKRQTQGNRHARLAEDSESALGRRRCESAGVTEEQITDVSSTTGAQGGVECAEGGVECVEGATLRTPV